MTALTNKRRCSLASPTTNRLLGAWRGRFLRRVPHLMSKARERSPMRRLATIEDVDSAASFLSSDIARNIAGGVLHVGAGRHIMIRRPKEPRRRT